MCIHLAPRTVTVLSFVNTVFGAFSEKTLAMFQHTRDGKQLDSAESTKDITRRTTLSVHSMKLLSQSALWEGVTPALLRTTGGTQESKESVFGALTSHRVM